MSNISLYQMTSEQRYINTLLEESDGELTPELEEALVISQSNMVSKAQNYVYAIKEYEAMEKRCAEEIQRLQAIKKRTEKIQDRLKVALLTAMEVYGFEKVQLDTHALSTRKSTTVVIDDETQIPDGFIKVTTSVDKAGVKAALKAGQPISGAHLQQNTSLQIR